MDSEMWGKIKGFAKSRKAGQQMMLGQGQAAVAGKALGNRGKQIDDSVEDAIDGGKDEAAEGEAPVNTRPFMKKREDSPEDKLRKAKKLSDMLKARSGGVPQSGGSASWESQ